MTGIAGTEKHLLTLLPGLQARGLDVHLLMLVEPALAMDDYADRMCSRGVRVERMPIHGDVDPNLITRIRRHILRAKPDAVHTHLIHADLHGIIAAERMKVPRIYSTCHNDDPFRSRWSIRMLQRYLWPRMTRAVAISEAMRRHAMEVQGAPAEKIVTIHHGLEIPPPRLNVPGRPTVRYTLGLAHDDIVFGSVCRLVEQKGLDDGLRAFAMVAEKIAKAHYVIAGDGPMRGELQKQVDTAGISDRVHFLNWRDDAPSLMSAFTALLMPSRWEGFGLVALEAMCASIPIVATRVSALPEVIVDKETGILTPPGDAAALADAMLELGTDLEKARAWGAAGRLRLEREFNADRMIEQTLVMYQEG